VKIKKLSEYFKRSNMLSDGYVDKKYFDKFSFIEYSLMCLIKIRSSTARQTLKCYELYDIIKLLLCVLDMLYLF